MQKYVVNRPDRKSMDKILAQNRETAAGVIIRLAWLLGLMREEIVSLTWDRVDFLDKCVRLPARCVPMTDEMSRYLSELRAYRNGNSEFVVLSDRDHKPLAPQSVSRVVRNALNAEGQGAVRLIDLRNDFILRQMEEHDWQYVSRICGIGAVTLNMHFAEYLPEKKVSTKVEREQSPQLDEFKLWKLLHEKQDRPEGIVLWLSWQMGLQLNEIAELKWNRVDLPGGVLRVPGREVPITGSVSQILGELKQKNERRSEFVVISPCAHKPFEKARLSKLARAALVQGGLDNLTLRDLRLDYDIRIGGENRIIQHVRKHGTITRNETMQLLGVSKSTAYTRLKQMVRRQKLVQVGIKYYLNGTVVPPERQTETILGYLTKEGFAYRQDIARLLHVEPNQCHLILKKLVASGAIVQDRQKYYLREA
jgi:integrase